MVSRKVPSRNGLALSTDTPLARSHASLMICTMGIAFRAESPAEPVSDLAERLRKSEIKKRQLQRRIQELLGDR